MKQKSIFRKPLFFDTNRQKTILTKGSFEMLVLIDIDELSQELRISVSQLRKRIAKARKGESDFPLPVTGYKEKNRWKRQDIENWIDRKSQPAPPVKTEVELKEQKRRDDIDRQLATKHGIR